MKHDSVMSVGEGECLTLPIRIIENPLVQPDTEEMNRINASVDSSAALNRGQSECHRVLTDNMGKWYF